MSSKISIPIIVILLLGVVAGGYFWYEMKTNSETEIARLTTLLTDEQAKSTGLQTKLTDTQNKLTDSQSQCTGLQTQLKDSQTQATGLQTKLTESQTLATGLQTQLKDSQTQATTLQANLQTANDSLKTQQTMNTSLSTELKKVKYPRHFASIQELTDWLHNDDTNTRYASETNGLRAYILMVKAIWDGYILPVAITTDSSGNVYVANEALIGDILYTVRSSDDATYSLARLSPLPSYPVSAP